MEALLITGIVILSIAGGFSAYMLGWMIFGRDEY